jgi:hypothetical protein
MNIPFSIRLAAIAAIIPIFAISTFAGPLDAYRGLNRLIVLSSPDASSAEKITALLVKERAQLEERNLKIIDVSEDAHRVDAALRLPPEQTAKTRKELNLKEGETRPVFILIGKDGGEKARCQDILELGKWLILIDQMPMRQAEAQDRKISTQPSSD